MKSEIYNAIANLNRSLDIALESLRVLHEQGVVSAEFVSDNSVRINSLWADINYMVMHKRSGNELDDRDHYGKMLDTIERRLRGEQTIEGLPLTEPKNG